MPYALKADFEKAFGEGEFSQLTGDDETIFEAAEIKAAAVVDGYVASKYALPLLTVPDLVKGWTLDIARFNLWDERAPEEVRARYDLALEQLRDLARGLVVLPPTVNGPVATDFATAGFKAERVFTSETLAGY